MKRKLRIESPDGRLHDTELRTDQKYESLKNYLMTGFSYLAGTGRIKNFSNPETYLLVGNVPTKIMTKKGHIYSSFRGELDGKDTIVVDDSLGKYETVAQMMHELVHGLYPRNSEHEVQVKTAKYLRTLVKEYDLFTDPRNKNNFLENQTSPNLLSKKDLAMSYKQAVSSEIYGLNKNNFKDKLRIKNGRSIDDLLPILLLIAGSVFILSSPINNITGNTIGESIIGLTLYNSFFVGAVFILLALLSKFKGKWHYDKSTN